MLEQPRIIAIDLDGTLLTHAKTISPRNKAAIEAARAHGTAVVLASGRTHEATGKYSHLLGMAPADIVISYNGARVGELDGPRLFERGVPADLAAYVIDYAEEHQLHLNFYYEDTLYVRDLNEWSRLYQGRTGTQPHPIGSLQKMKGKSPTKLLIVNSLERTNGLIAPMKVHFGESLYITKTDDEYLEFMNPQVNKGAALAFVAEKLGVDRSLTWAFGDNYNDIPMLEWAGRSFAMANGKPEAKAAAADEAPDSEEDGVAQVLERVFPVQEIAAR